MLPCPQGPPPPPVVTGVAPDEVSKGGHRWYHVEFTRYSCPAGKIFSSGMFPFWYSNCTVEKVWDPDVADTCIGESNFLILQYTALETKLFASIFSHILFNFSNT